MSAQSFPTTQSAVQAVGPGKLELNKKKPVFEVGPHQILVEVQAVGLCFSDLKLLSQFDKHPRKSDVLKGILPDALKEIPSYVPNDKPTVPGHEVVCKVVAAGDQVKHYKVGERCLVQADFRDLKTAGSNGAFGYNFEGGLQQYILLDERVIVDESGERYLIPVSDELGASQAALVEPWACVEDSYVTPERQSILAGGQLLIVAEEGHKVEGVDQCFSHDGKPAKITAKCVTDEQKKAVDALGVEVEYVEDLSALPKEGFDDIVYFGCIKPTVETLSEKLNAGAIANIVTNGKKFGELVTIGVGRIHYGYTRWVGTRTSNAADSYTIIPNSSDVRDGDSILIVGAGGPMGQMHVIRDICSGRVGINVVGTDFDDARLKMLEKKAKPFAEANRATFKTINPQKEKIVGNFSYIVVMAPIAPVVAEAVSQSQVGAIINIFAGVPAPVVHPMDLDAIIEKRIFLFGTSGSTIDDMKIVLNKVTEGSLNTNSSVDAVSGLAGAIDGIKAVEERTMAGKIIVYPSLPDLPLIGLDELEEKLPSVAAALEDGQWCPAAEQELLKVGGSYKP